MYVWKVTEELLNVFNCGVAQFKLEYVEIFKVIREALDIIFKACLYLSCFLLVAEEQREIFVVVRYLQKTSIFSIF